VTVRVCDLTTGANKLLLSYQALKLAWNNTAEQWRDSVRAEFEATYLEPLEPEIKAAVDAIQRLDQVLAQAYHECES
jgi:hypothetical protein